MASAGGAGKLDPNAPSPGTTGAPLEVVHSAPSSVGGRPADWREGLPTLVTDALELREPTIADAASLFKHLATDQVARFMSRPPSRAEGFERFVSWIQAERRAGRCFCYAIFPQEHDGAVGLLQVRQLEPGFGTAEWGFAVGQAYWGSGLFVTCAVAVVDFVFRHVGAYRLEARASTKNDRGNGALRKLGATAEGVLRQALLGAGEPMDQWLWSMHAEDWLSRHPVPPYQLREACADPQAPAQPVARQSTAPAPAWRDALPTLTSPGCTLRDLQLQDAPILLGQLKNPDVERFIIPGPPTIEAFEGFITWALRQRQAGRYACFAALPPGGPEPVGIFQLRQLDPGFKTAEWGFVLGPTYWGSGIFLAAATLLLDFAFDTIGVHRLEARAAVSNARGNGALRKVGATLEGYLRRSFLLGGVYHDDALWALLADDWRRVRASFLLG